MQFEESSFFGTISLKGSINLFDLLAELNVHRNFPLVCIQSSIQSGKANSQKTLTKVHRFKLCLDKFFYRNESHHSSIIRTKYKETINQMLIGSAGILINV